MTMMRRCLTATMAWNRSFGRPDAMFTSYSWLAPSRSAIESNTATSRTM
jgi:hypothetical protein